MVIFFKDTISIFLQFLSGLTIVFSQNFPHQTFNQDTRTLPCFAGDGETLESGAEVTCSGAPLKSGGDITADVISLFLCYFTGKRYLLQ